jgi:hypothetical protein
MVFRSGALRRGLKSDFSIRMPNIEITAMESSREDQ